MPIQDDLNAYRAQINNDISTQSDPDSIAPDTVGSMGIDLADIIEPELMQINLFGISSGTALPAGGVEKNLYYRSILNGIEIYRKLNGNWIYQTTISIGLSYPDGILVGLRTSIQSYNVTISPGTWAISNIVYNKLTQTQLTIAAKDLNFGRWDLIYANNLNQINLITGIASSTPVKPNLPANSILIDYVYVPNIGLPFLLAGTTGTISNGDASKSEITVNDGQLIINWQTDIIPNDILTYAQKHGNSIANIQGHYDAGGGIMTPYSPEYTYNLNSNETINILTLTTLFAGKLTII